MIALVGAMDEEIEDILSNMTDIREKHISNRTFYFGKFKNQEVVLVASGIGMVSASITTSILCQMDNVEYLIFTGVAGSLNDNINVLDVVISTDSVEYLFDATSFGYKLGEIPRLKESEFKASEKLINKVKKLNNLDFNIHFGRIVSGDKFVSNKIEKKYIGDSFKAYAVDMESAAFAHVCYEYSKEFIIIRSISDSLTDDSIIEYDKFLKFAVKNNLKILGDIIE